MIDFTTPRVFAAVATMLVSGCVWDAPSGGPLLFDDATLLDLGDGLDNLILWALRPGNHSQPVVLPIPRGERLWFVDSDTIGVEKGDSVTYYGFPSGEVIGSIFLQSGRFLAVGPRHAYESLALKTSDGEVRELTMGRDGYRVVHRCSSCEPVGTGDVSPDARTLAVPIMGVPGDSAPIAGGPIELIGLDGTSTQRSSGRGHAARFITNQSLYAASAVSITEHEFLLNTSRTTVTVPRSERISGIATDSVQDLTYSVTIFKNVRETVHLPIGDFDRAELRFLSSGEGSEWTVGRTTSFTMAFEMVPSGGAVVIAFSERAS